MFHRYMVYMVDLVDTVSIFDSWCMMYVVDIRSMSHSDIPQCSWTCTLVAICESMSLHLSRLEPKLSVRVNVLYCQLSKH